jgi:flavin reductase
MTIADDLGVRFGREIARVPTCVTVVTTGGPAGRAGQTVSAVSTASYEPPMLAVCIQGRSPANDAIVTNGYFAVNVLGLAHDHVADTFAGRPWPGKQPWDFTCGDWSVGGDGLPRLGDAPLVATCRLVSTVEAGGHLLHLGEVADLAAHDGEPLVYAARRYGRHVPIEPTRFAHLPEAKPVPRVRRPHDPHR